MLNSYHYMLRLIISNFFKIQHSSARKCPSVKYKTVLSGLFNPQLMVFGFFICLNAFLFLVTFLPVRLVLSGVRFLWKVFTCSR